ncbi:hypothetical protein B6E66_31650 [Streptomyces maremycinicus]|uniref:DUF3592 domain-containing protein n=1 Tax=Streptomyces maremycinicus TaxID=1679753 RepID=UPI0007882244|nr:DUF3592 domain-containing protein [Streptomyces sp. NBRC 110468]OQR60203.1 hypothetical protein B6E66_31650 [Streptomyces sp. B9173]
MTIEQLGGSFVAATTGTLCVLMAVQAMSRCRLRLRGVRTTAELVRFREAREEDGHELYYAVVTFALPDGSEVTAETSEAVRHLPRGIQEGDITEVLYDPAAPSVFTLPSVLPGRLRTTEILSLCAGCLGLAATTWLILADTF